MKNTLSTSRIHSLYLALTASMLLTACTCDSNEIANCTGSIFSSQEGRTITFSLGDTIVNEPRGDKGTMATYNTASAVKIYTRFRH